MKTTTLGVELTFTTPILGSASGNPKLHEEFIASKAPTVEQTQEEMGTVEERLEKAMTVFHRDDTGLFIFDYHVRGFFKSALRALGETGQIEISRWQIKRIVDCLVFVNPRRIYFLKPSGEKWSVPDSTLTRPLRAETMQGDRVALSTSEQLPEGTVVKFEIELVAGTSPKSKIAVLDLDDIENCLDYGKFMGISQWHSGGWGRFTWKEMSS